MYAYYPDWWDIGKTYGARAYITALMSRAIREYVYISTRLKITHDALSEYYNIAQHMREQLVKKLWNNDAEYLMNMLDTVSIDRHYYAGSLVAAVFDVLDDEKKEMLMKSADRELLNPQIGTHIVMPADFHQLSNVYKFKGMEVGEPFTYLNGGVWPHGIVWHAMGWLSAGHTDRATEIIRKYYTLNGVKNSPNGQPSFFEYRYSNPDSERFGEIDKPTFLWAGGWYLYAFYHLAGMRENEWNIFFDSRLPSGWEKVGYQLMVAGSQTQVMYTGQGEYFRKIQANGKPSATAVFSTPQTKIIFERGIPESPYLAEATGLISQVFFDELNRYLNIKVSGFTGLPIKLRIVSPFPSRKLLINGKESPTAVSKETDGEISIIHVNFILSKPQEEIRIEF